jgi:hypothetical protein
MQHPKLIGINTTALSLASLLAACASDPVDLGGGTSIEQSLEVGARCVESPIVEGDVFVGQRDELEALRGCEAIRGDFTLMVFEDTDLSPLASLREVSGAIRIGARARPIPDEIIENPQGTELAEAFEAEAAEAARSAEIVEAGWLESLHGLEALEHAGQLILSGIAAPDLGVFEGLRNLSNHPLPTEAGFLQINQARNLVDLRGLEGVGGIRDLRVDENPSLVGLDGVELGARMDSISLERNPLLNDLTALSSVDSLGGLAITGSGVVHLAGLENLSFCDGVALVDNPELEDVSALARLELATSLIFLSNPKLESLPEFSVLGSPIEEFRVIGNAALRSVSLSFPFSRTRTWEIDSASGADAEQPQSGEPREVEVGYAWFELSDNPQLESVAFGGTLTSALVLEVNRNAGLSSIDLGTVRSLNVLSIYGNAALSSVALGDIQSINLISVVDNPSLPVAELRTVRSFETVTSGNADDAAE